MHIEEKIKDHIVDSVLTAPSEGPRNQKIYEKRNNSSWKLFRPPSPNPAYNLHDITYSMNRMCIQEDGLNYPEGMLVQLFHLQFQLKVRPLTCLISIDLNNKNHKGKGFRRFRPQNRFRKYQR